MDLDAGRPARPVGEPAGQPFESSPPQGVHDGAVPDERVQARVAGQHLPGRAGGGIPLEHDPDVFAQAVEHAVILAFPTVTLNY